MIYKKIQVKQYAYKSQFLENVILYFKDCWNTKGTS